MIGKIVAIAVAVIAITIAIALGVADEDTENVALTPSLEQWKNTGTLEKVYGHDMFVVDLEQEGEKSGDVVVMIHGFPSSSFDYRHAIEHFRKKTRVIAFDHVGFGFSSKPSRFSYSLMEHADNALELIRRTLAKGKQDSNWKIHLIAHDMGDSVAVEILSRVQKRLVPEFFQNSIKSAIFNNGGMRYHLISFRFAQRLLMTPYVGEIFARLNFLDKKSFAMKKTLLGIWGTRDSQDESIKTKMENDIKDMVVAFQYNNGARLAHRLSYYLTERAIFDDRWIGSLSLFNQESNQDSMKLKITLIWGDNDPVSPISIPLSVKESVPSASIIFMKGVGHFLMIEKPQDWSDLVLQNLEWSN